MPISTVTSKGQVTVPKAIRDRLNIQEGDQLEFRVDEEGRIIVRPHGDGISVRGVLGGFAPDEPVSVEVMNRAVRKRVAEKAERG